MTTVINGSSPSITFSDSTTQASAGLPLTGGTLSGALTVPTLNAPSGVLATQNGMTGIAKAWVNFAGASGTINASYNVSSVTRTGTGAYTINITTAMASASYTTVGTSSQYNSFVSLDTAAATTTTRPVIVRQSDVPVNSIDPVSVQVAIFGA